jgi:hypothetical protein
MHLSVQGLTHAVGALCTLAILSVLYRENRFYRLFEHLFIGVAAAFGLFMTWANVLQGKWWEPLSKEGRWYWLLAPCLGALFYTVYSKKHAWMSRLLIGTLFGIGAGQMFQGFASQMFPQITSTFRPVIASGPTLSGPRDLKDPVALAVQLRDAQDPLSQHLRGKLSPETRKLLAAYRGAVPTGSPLLAPSDVRDWVDLASKIRELRDPLSRFLREQFAIGTQCLLDSYAGRDPGTDLQDQLVPEFNLVLQGPPLYEQDLFSGVRLAPDTRKLLAEDPEGEDPIRLNRLLLEDAYPAEIATVRAPARSVQRVLIRDLNRVIRGPALYDAKLFSHVTLAATTQKLLAGKPNGGALARLNRVLLEQAYPGALAKSVSWPVALNNLLFVAILACVMCYFFFSFRHERAPWVREPAKAGRWLLMVAFGATFGSTVMARFSLFIDRMQFLLGDWLHLLK